MIIIEVKNKEILNILENTLSKDTESNIFSKAKGFDISEYDEISNLYTSNNMLLDALKNNKTIPSYKFNKIIGETEAGLYFFNSIRPILNAEYEYTSAYIPKGFHGWHNDSTEARHSIFFSYATNTSGFFKYRIANSDTIVTVPDIIGWNVRGLYLGDTPETELWHCIKCDSYRISFMIQYQSKDKYEEALNILTKN